MPVKRRLPKGRAHRITPEVLALWATVKRHEKAGLRCEKAEHYAGYAWESAARPEAFVWRCLPGCAEYREAKHALHRALGFPPWEPDLPDDVVAELEAAAR
jgi:hypothetical protein